MDESELDENRIGRKKLDENRLDENRLDENWVYRLYLRPTLVLWLSSTNFIRYTDETLKIETRL